MNKRIAVTGYSGTGSSAVIDYLKEFQNYDIALSDNYEHVLLYYPDTIFDLNQKLLYNNDPLRSDEAIKEFRKAMDFLYKKDFGWFGSYKELIGEDFEKLVNNYLENITEGKINAFWYYNYKNVKFSFIKCILQFCAKIILKRPIFKWGRKYVISKNEMEYSFINKHDFEKYTKEFIEGYFDLCEKYTEKAYIYDHLIWPSQANALVKLTDTAKMIILHRDPRDLFFINKYYWCSPKVKTPGTYPLDVDVFCDYFKGLKRDGAIDSEDILNINFEDLVYTYEETTAKINEFLDITENDKKNKLKYFDPKKSIMNTQVYTGKPEWESELKVIEEKLSDYLYDFPYKNETSISKMFL